MVESNKGVYSNSEATDLTIQNFVIRLSSDQRFKQLATTLLAALRSEGITGCFPVLKSIADYAKEVNEPRIRRVALALSYSEEEEEDFASKDDLEWIPRVKEGLSSYGLESVEYQITEDATSFQEAWYFPGRRISHPELGSLLIGVDYQLEPRTAKPIPAGYIALSVFFDIIVPDSKGTASKHILPLYLVVVKNTKLAVKLGLLKLRFKVGFNNVEAKLYSRFQEIKAKKA